MLYEIEGFPDYLVDDEGQVFRKPGVWRFGSCKRKQPMKKMTASDHGRYLLRKGGIQYRVSPAEALARRKGEQTETEGEV